MCKIRWIFVSLVLGLFGVNGVLAKGSELKFESEISAIGETDGGIGVLTIVVKGFEVPIIVDEDTRIEAEGDEVGLADLAVGDKVKVEAWFEDGAIVAEEVRLLEREREQFRLRGEITDVEFAGTPTATGTAEATRITLLGVDVFVDGETRITSRGSGKGNKVPASELMVGDQVDVTGSYDGSLLWADRLKVGERELGYIEVGGEYLEATEDGFRIDLREGGTLRVVVTEDTVIEGEAEEGGEVKVEGMLNESLSIVAVEVKFGHGSGASGKSNGKAKGKAKDEHEEEEEGAESVED